MSLDLNSLSQAELIALLAKAQTDLAKAKASTGSRIKVSAKGAISVYGFGRWPVTLYKSQMQAFIAMVPQIEEFIQANGHLLAEKPVKGEESETEAATA